MASCDSWASILRTLDALSPSLSTSASPEAGNVSIQTACSSSPNLIAKRRDVDKRHELLLRALELHSIEEKHLSLLEKRAQNAKLAVHRLPIELLMTIFVEAAASVVGDENPADTLHSFRSFDPIPLAGVCHHWMNIVLGLSGAPLWTNLMAHTRDHDTNFRAARRLHVWLPRSGNFLYDLDLDTFGSESSGEPVVVEAVLPHAARCRTLGIGGFAYRESMCPVDLTGRWKGLAHLVVSMMESDDLEFDEIGRSPPFFLPAESRALTTLTVQDWFHPSREDVDYYLEAPLLCPKIQHLTLRDVLFSFDRLLWLLRLFPGLVQFRLSTAAALEDMQLPLDHARVSLSVLDSLEFRGRVDELKALLMAINTPSLRSLHVIRGAGVVPYDVSPRLPKLTMLELCDAPETTYDLGTIVRNPGSLRSILYYPKSRKLHVGLGQLVQLARALPANVERAVSPLRDGQQLGDDHWLVLSIGLAQEHRGDAVDASSDEAMEFVLQLEAFGMMRDARERAYGSAFRIEISSRLAEWWPLVAEVVQRHSDIFELGERDSYATTWWNRYGSG